MAKGGEESMEARRSNPWKNAWLLPEKRFFGRFLLNALWHETKRAEAKKHPPFWKSVFLFF
jgi:hypothetical protein